MAMTPAGRRDTRIRFDRAEVVRDALGRKDDGEESWVPIGGPRMAKVLWGSGSERRAAAVEEAVQPATFRVLADSVTRQVSERDRIVIVRGGLTFDVTGLAPIGRSEIEFTAVASRA